MIFVNQGMTYNADVKILAWSRSWKCLGCFLFNWFVVFSEQAQDGVHVGSKANFSIGTLWVASFIFHSTFLFHALYRKWSLEYSEVSK